MSETAPDLPPLLGEAPCFLEMLELVSRVAPAPRPVLVIGERGTGKELVAARLHYLSDRWERPFVKVNCAALSDDLLDSELFGHEAGAFTGAVRRHAGRFERADGGSLFLDEIADASLRVQEKILRAIEYGEIERVGGSQTLHVDVRVIGATNRDLPCEAAAGRFRADLLDRLAFDVVTLPPLRERTGDVPLLAEHFARAMAGELGRPSFAGISAEAKARLQAHAWPGNVRELKNAVERSVHRAERDDGPLDDLFLDPFASPYRPAAASDLAAANTTEADRPSEIGGPDAAGFLERVATFERTLLDRALRDSKYNQKKTAAVLGVSYHQLRGYLKKHSLIPRNRNSIP
ncbi:MAG: phage shock protein operon transcriptional activator [Inquilinus sp.]|nr:phage shock protein operon transcriptional activator [Inquilinus sp.]